MSSIGRTAAFAVATILLAGSVSAQANQQLQLSLSHAFAHIGYVVPALATPTDRQWAEAELVMSDGEEGAVSKRAALDVIFSKN
jgi:hypothetical protein